MKSITIVGQKFGRLTVVGMEYSGKGKRPKVRCVCDCGNERLVQKSHLRCGATQSCGCLRNERIRDACSTHGERHTKTYHVWQEMKQRCQNPNSLSYHKYGSRGIRVCEKWQTFEGFIADMGHPSDGYSIERIDNTGDYEPSNCRWANVEDQAKNRRNVIMITHNGKTQCAADWARDLGIDPRTFRSRIAKGWSHEKAVTTPLRKWPSQR